MASVVVLTSCATAPTDRKRPAPEPVQVVKVTPLEKTEIPEPEPEPEESFTSRSELVTAAQSWIDASHYTVGEDRQDLLLRSAAALIQAERFDDAKRILDGIDVAGLPVRYTERRRLLTIQWSLATGRIDLAGRYLARYRRLRDLDPEFATQILGLSARAHALSKQAIQAAEDLVRREQYLTDPGDIASNRWRIWRVLGTTSPLEIQIARQTSQNPALADWLDLTLLVDDFGSDPHRLRQSLEDWAQIDPMGGARVFAREMLRMSGPPGGSPSAPIIKVALLLPLASKFGAAAQAVYDGYNAMRSLDGNPLRPDVVLYDVGEVPELATSYYRLAIDEGANLVIGPLGRQAATAIANTRHEPNVPTILLGGIGETSALPARTFQIDLAPEREAGQVAERAYRDGHRVAAVLAPDSEWGQRVSRAFIEKWRSLGGTMASDQIYDETANDHSLAIKRMLNLENSEERKRALAAALGATLEFRPRRRQDLDIIFLAARPVAGRLIKPQINFYQAHDIPVYSTSHIYSGAVDVVNDADLNGVLFGDMPWLIRRDRRMDALRASTDAVTPSQPELERLFALGLDAYLLSSIIPYTEPGYSSTLLGVSGERLEVSASGRIDRQLTWAHFEEGVPVVLDDREVTYTYEDIEPGDLGKTGPSLENGAMGGATRPSVPY